MISWLAHQFRMFMNSDGFQVVYPSLPDQKMNPLQFTRTVKMHYRDAVTYATWSMPECANCLSKEQK